MSVTPVESSVLGMEVISGPMDGPSALQEKIEQHRRGLQAIFSLLGGSDLAGEVRQAIESVLRACRDDMVSTRAALREDGRNA